MICKRAGWAKTLRQPAAFSIFSFFLFFLIASYALEYVAEASFLSFDSILFFEYFFTIEEIIDESKP